MPSTPILALPYPALSDPADVPTDMAELAARLDQVTPIGRGANLPAAPFDGQLFEWVVDDAAGIQWLMRYNAAAPTYKWECCGGPPRIAHDAGALVGATLPDYAPGLPSITIPKTGLWAVRWGAYLVASSGPGGIGSTFLALLVNNLPVGRTAGYQGGAGTAAEAPSEYQGAIAKNATVATGTAAQSGSASQSLNRWVAWQPIRIAND